MVLRVVFTVFEVTTVTPTGFTGDGTLPVGRGARRVTAPAHPCCEVTQEK